jgi:tetratricopeptide (TPR) repeat protein
VDSRAEAARLAAQAAAHWLNEADRRRGAARLLGTIGALREALKVDPSSITGKLLQDAIARLSDFDRLVTASNSHEQRAPGETIRLMNKILEIKPDYAPAHGELGTMYALMGDQAAAHAQLRTGAEHDPEDSYCVSTLAALMYREERWEDAASLFAKADAIEPYDASIQNGWGLALLKLERWDDAAVHFRRALTIDPRHSDGSAGLSEVLRLQGQIPEAVLHARRAVRWTDGKNAKFLVTLADAYTAAKRPADAHKTLEQALTAAETTNPGLVPTIRGRLARLR